MDSLKPDVKLIIVGSPETPELVELRHLPATVKIVGTGQKAQDFSHLSEEDWQSVNVMLICGVGKNAGKRDDIKEIWPRLVNLKWLHSNSAGLEHLLFDDLTNGPVTLTNAKGVYSHSLAEYTLFACNWFAKDFLRLRAAQKAHTWDPFEVEELRSSTMGVVGFGDIGQSCARLARAFKMNVIASRRRTELTEAEQKEGLVDKIYPPEQLNALMAASDYVVVATPLTPQTLHLINDAAIRAMKPNGVIVNVGRGKCIDEPALINALREGRIRGAALDVFDTEPLPADSPLWDLDNVLMSPHCADRTKTFQYEAMRLFLDNMKRYTKGEALLNVCDKRAGY